MSFYRIVSLAVVYYIIGAVLTNLDASLAQYIIMYASSGIMFLITSATVRIDTLSERRR